MSDVESVNVEEVNSRNVSDGSLEGLGLVVTNNQRTSSVLESSVSELTLSSSDLLVVSDSEDVVANSESGEDLADFLCLGNVVDAVGEDQRKLRNSHDLVTSSQDERSNSSGSDSGSQGVSSLLEVDLSVPSSPYSQRVGHSTSSAHVTVGTLA